MTPPSVMTPPAVMTVFPVRPRFTCRAGRAGLTRGTGGAWRAWRAVLDAVPLEVDAPCLKCVDLLLVGDEHS